MDFENGRVIWVETSPTNKTITTNLSQTVYTAVDVFDAVTIPAVVVFGLIGNLLSVFVFGTTKLSEFSSSTYLTALAVSDGLSLLNLLLVSIPDRHSPVHVPALCNLIVYSINVFGMISSWLVVMFTVERFVVIQYPLHKLAKCSSRKARRLILTVVPFPCLWYIYTFVIVGVDADSQRCTVLMRYQVEMTVFHAVDILIVYLVPAIVVTLLNIRIARVLARCQRRRSKMQNGKDIECRQRRVSLRSQIVRSDVVVTQLSRRPTLRSLSRTTSVSITANYAAVAVDDFTTGSGNTVTTSVTNACSRSADLAITRTLIATSTAFAVLNLPHNTIQMVRSIVPLLGDLFVDDTLHVLTSLSNDIYYLNFAINVLVYHLTSSNYRKGAKRVLNRLLWLRCCWCRKKSERNARNFREQRSKHATSTTSRLLQKSTIIVNNTKQ